MTQQKIKAVLFDLDMTLADLMTAKTSAIDSAISAMINAGLKMEKDAAYEELKKEYFKDFEGRSVITNFLKNQMEENPRISSFHEKLDAMELTAPSRNGLAQTNCAE